MTDEVELLRMLHDEDAKTRLAACELFSKAPVISLDAINALNFITHDLNLEVAASARQALAMQLERSLARQKAEKEVSLQRKATMQTQSTQSHFSSNIATPLREELNSDFRSPLERILDWWGLPILMVASGATAIWGNVNQNLAVVLLGMSVFLAGLLQSRRSLRGKYGTYAVIFIIGGLAIIGYGILLILSSLSGT